MILAVFMAAFFSISAVWAADSNKMAAEKPSGEKTPENAASVNGEMIPYADLALEIELYKRRMQDQGRQMPEAFLPQIRAELLSKMIDHELLYQESKKKGVKISAQDVDKEMTTIKGRWPDTKQFEAALANMQLTESQLRDQIMRRMAVRYLVEKTIAPEVEIKDEEAKAFYDQHDELFQRPEQVRARHILIKVSPDATEKEKADARKELADIKKHIDAGEDFAELAKSHSQCPSSERGGDLGYFPKGRMVPSFEEKVFNMKPNEVSDIVETQFGYHLIKLLDRRPAETVSYEDSKGRIVNNLQNQRIQEKVSDYLVKLRKDAKIKTFIE